ncbi:hypothetical protein [Roseateles sp. L2-2]|uniref:hypothetical protein n=1 Tax=Roseateles sp. L2-2 TaxID=3422597 RepID=UPI003D36F0B0
MKLQRFWVVFRNPPAFSPLGIGCGISAFDHHDALKLLEATVFKEHGALEIASIAEDVDVSTLNPLHVLPNMGSCLIRGLWFPQT